MYLSHLACPTNSRDKTFGFFNFSSTKFKSKQQNTKEKQLKMSTIDGQFTKKPHGMVTAIDEVTIVVKECILISSSMRKISKYSQSGVAAILGGSSADLFNDNNEFSKFGLNSNNSNGQAINDPLLSGFIQLRLMLNNLNDLSDVDSLTLLQPFLLVIKSSSTTGSITALALDSVSKFINYKIISKESKNFNFTLTHIIHSLTHCRFEASEQSSDDAVLLKVLRLLEVLIDSDLGNILSDEVVYEVVQTSLSLACNKRRSEVLRKAAELTLYGITNKIFTRLDEIEPEQTEHIVEETQDFSKAQLTDDLGPKEAEEDNHKKSMEVLKTPESPFGLISIKQLLGLLISMISPENQLKQTESTKVFALSLIRSSVELSGDKFHKFPSLLSLFADSVFKHTLQLIRNSNSLPLLQASLQLFTTLALSLGEFLPSQIELTLRTIFKLVLPSDQSKEKLNNKSGKSTPIDSNAKSNAAKEIIVEEISILWTRSPNLFVQLFIDFDCNFHREDLSIQFIEFLSQLSLPQSALFTTDFVPPTCLEGLLTFISSLSEQIKDFEEYNDLNKNELLINKNKKKEFIVATAVFNKKPKDGLKALQEKGFIKSIDDIKELALFFYEQSSRLNKKVLGEYLAKADNANLFKEFLNLFHFKGLRVDEALRILLKTFRLPGESQQIERIVEIFSARYVDSQEFNKEDEAKDDKPDSEKTEEELEPVQPDADAVFVLSYSIIMLNTDLHNPVIKEHMTLDGYKKNLRGVYNGKDFPGWYLQKIFTSINDKEIVMPEEHHDSSLYFEDLWNNLISTNLALSKNPSTESFTKFSKNELLQFNKYIFQSTFDKLSITIFKIFDSAVDDQVITKMMTTIDHLAQVASFFKLNSSVDSLVSSLAAETKLDGSKKLELNRGNRTSPLRLTRIRVEGGETINVSSVADAFGSDFKAQLSTVVLFRVLQRNVNILKSSWVNILTIIFTLLRNGLLDPNITFNFQEKYQFDPLPGIVPDIVLNRSAATKGLLSTFASYLKGEDEPTDEEVESTLSALDCIKSANIYSIFEDTSGLDIQSLIYSIWEFLPEKLSNENKVYYDSQLFMVTELSLSLILSQEKSSEWDNELIKIIEKHLANDNFHETLKFRLLAYLLLLFNHIGDVDEEPILKALDDLVTIDKDTYDKSASELVDPLTNLIDVSKHRQEILNSENYWKILRLIASNSKFTLQIFRFTEKLVKSSINENINQTNFMWLLGLLDEISAVGAIGGQWEHEYDTLIKSGKRVTNKENPHQEIVQLSLQSIKFTSSLAELKGHLSKEEMYALIQALAHQCLNPCFQIRSYSLSSLEETLLGVQTGTKEEDITEKGIFELGLFPLLNEDIEILEILKLISKVYLHFFEANEGVIDDEIFVKILDVFNQRLEDDKIEEEMQKLIQNKKSIEKSKNKDLTNEKVEELQEPTPEATESESSTVSDTTNDELTDKTITNGNVEEVD